MSIIGTPGQRWHFVGNSITSPAVQWYLGLVDDINAAIAALPTRPRAARNVGVTARSAALSAKARTQSVPNAPISVTASGVAGNTAADIEADVPGRITDFNPDVTVLEVGINDAIDGTTGIDFQNSYASILDQVKAWRASEQILCISCLCNGELGEAGPNWWAGDLNFFDANILEIDSRMQGVIPARGAIYTDVRTVLGVFESVNNLPPPGAASGVATSDGTHPNATGKALMCAAAFALVDVQQN